VINAFARAKEPSIVAALLPSTTGLDAVRAVADIVAPIVNGRC